MQITLIRLPVASFKKIDTPFKEDGVRSYIAVVNVKDIAQEFKEWRNLITKDTSTDYSVVEQITETLRESPSSFFLKNRGLVIIANKVVFDNKFNEVKLEIVNKGYDGVIDGKQTLHAIMSFVSTLREHEVRNLDSYVKIEILEGVRRNDIEDITLARNTSSQSNISNLDNLGINQDRIIEAVQQYSYQSQSKSTTKRRSPIERDFGISYSMNDSVFMDSVEYSEPSHSFSDVDVERILPCLMCFDVEYFDNNRHPVMAYKSKASVLEHFRLNNSGGRMEKYNTLLPKILELHDEIYLNLPDAYNKEGGDFDSLAGVTRISNVQQNNSPKLFLADKNVRHHIPKGYIFPILASFRCLVEVKRGSCSWRTDPVKLFHELKLDLARRINEPASIYRDSNRFGEDSMIWGRCYDLVELTILKRKL